MRFTYKYKTSDGERHEGVCSAVSRTAAYEKLRAGGIKPFGVELAPGLFNRMQDALGRRRVLLPCLIVAVGISFFVILNRSGRLDSDEARDLIHSKIRRQPMGDAAVIDMGIRNGWRDYFPDEGERYLASYAIPGAIPVITSVNEGALQMCLGKSCDRKDGYSIEVQQISAMIDGLKLEARAYLDAGGSLEDYADRLHKRQMEELGYYQRCEKEMEIIKKRGVKGDELVSEWEARNTKLRRMGIRPLPLSDIEGE